ncbi:hypothetical protein Sjap_021734 [Stephania japonica]|uniref:Uncharacterized protein n=1 Tax=Stephania japonica TaxID=461633 RepID=A0AAP0HT36_9MAGN
MADALEGLVPMFFRANAEWDVTPTTPCSLPLSPSFLFHVFASASNLVIRATDFSAHTLECNKSMAQLEDLRADVAVGGSLSELVDYLVASLNSGNVKLVLGGLIETKKFSGATYGKLITYKSKGMPVVTISLGRITNESADNAIGKLSWELFEAFTREHELVAKEQARSYRLSKMLEAEKAKSEDIQDQLRVFLSSRKKEKNDNARKMLPALASASPTSLDVIPISASPVSVGELVVVSFDKILSDVLELHNYDVQNLDVFHTFESILFPYWDQLSGPVLVLAAAKLPSNSVSFKAETRVVPAYRRAKVRGIFLEDEDGGSN